MQHEVDTRYSTLRYLVWVIPTIGFIGTVVGIAAALNQAGAADDYQDPALLGELTRSGVGALIQRGGRAVAGMLTIATAGGS